ncbi:hypothetical protein CUMW_244270 [Citrus unshiu]|nr:hypothetical protein CUMW_244270 [Citrus unshiu]
MSYIVLQNIHHVAPPKAPKTLFRSVLFALITTVLEYALLIALRSLNFLAVPLDLHPIHLVISMFIVSVRYSGIKKKEMEF